MLVWPLLLAICFDLFEVTFIPGDWLAMPDSLLLFTVLMELIGWLSYALKMQSLVKEIMHWRLAVLHLFYGLIVVACLVWPAHY